MDVEVADGKSGRVRDDREDRASGRGRAGVARCAVLVVSVATLAGCGGSQNGVANSAVSQVRSPGSAPAAAHDGARLHVEHRFRGRQGAERFRSLTNNVCGAVRSGPPAPMGAPLTASKLRRYASAAGKATQRTSRALERIGVAGSLRKPVERLLDALQHLEGIYRAAGHVNGGERNIEAEVRSLSAAEAQVASAAIASGLPGCAPRPPGVGVVGGPPSTGAATIHPSAAPLKQSK